MDPEIEARRARIRAASNGDAEHAERVERELERARRRRRPAELPPLPPLPPGIVSDGRGELRAGWFLALGVVLGFGLAALVAVATVAFYLGYLAAR